MIIIRLIESIKKFLRTPPRREEEIRKNTRKMIKKYNKTLRKLSYE